MRWIKTFSTEGFNKLSATCGASCHADDAKLSCGRLISPSTHLFVHDTPPLDQLRLRHPIRLQGLHTSTHQLSLPLPVCSVPRVIWIKVKEDVVKKNIIIQSQRDHPVTICQIGPQHSVVCILICFLLSILGFIATILVLNFIAQNVRGLNLTKTLSSGLEPG